MVLGVTDAAAPLMETMDTSTDETEMSDNDNDFELENTNI